MGVVFWGFIWWGMFDEGFRMDGEVGVGDGGVWWFVGGRVGGGLRLYVVMWGWVWCVGCLGWYVLVVYGLRMGLFLLWFVVGKVLGVVVLRGLSVGVGEGD
uniref:Transmembrane protein n=1 Tax=Knipowitschia caucasica TaxID=637954 RepID=A0AAV2JY71_KNICA